MEPDRQRAQPPIRWPHPGRTALVCTTLWVLGLVIALAVPALVVPPTAVHASLARAWTAFCFTVLGAALVLGSTVLAWRRSGDSSILTLGAVPAGTLIAGGIILATAKIN